MKNGYIERFSALMCFLEAAIAAMVWTISRRILVFSLKVWPGVFSAAWWRFNALSSCAWWLCSWCIFVMAIPEILMLLVPFLPGFIFTLILRGAAGAAFFGCAGRLFTLPTARFFGAAFLATALFLGAAFLVARLALATAFTASACVRFGCLRRYAAALLKRFVAIICVF